MRALLIGPENPHFVGHLRTLQMLPEVTHIHLCPSAEAESALLDEPARLYPDKLAQPAVTVDQALRDWPIDFVVSSPRNDRAVPIAERVLGAGKPLLHEKPLGRNAAEAARIVELARRAGLPLAVCYQNRLHPAAQAARDFVASGLLGEVMAVELRYFTTQPKFRDPAHWLFRRSQSGGGVLQWLGCHYLDLAAFVTGERIVSVQGSIATRSGEQIDVEDTAAVQLRFERGGVGSLSCGYVLAQSGGGYYNRAGNDTYVAFIGRLGRVWWYPTQAPSLVNMESVHPAWALSPRRSVTFELPESPAYGGVHGEEFMRRFLNGKPVATGEDALRVAELLEMIYT